MFRSGETELIMRGIERIGVVLASLLLLVVMASLPANAQESIRIGVLLPLTGPLAKNGLENWEAMQIARDMINERGGINGRKIEYLQGDANTPNAAISETERLITKDGIKITTGSFASPIAIAVSQAAERHGVFHWETTGAAEGITRRGFKHTFQVGAPARKYGQAAVDFILNDLAKRLNKPVEALKIALLWENRAFGKSVGDGIRALYPGQGHQARLRRGLRSNRDRHDADRAEVVGRGVCFCLCVLVSFCCFVFFVLG